MSSVPSAGVKDLVKLIMQYIPRDVLMACEDACFNGDEKGRIQATAFAKGHRPSAVGQNRHFFTNEAFYEALLVHGANPTPLRGTQVVVGQLGIFKIARVNVPGHKWSSGFKRSATRQQLSQINVELKRMFVQPDLFDQATEPTGGTIFIVGVLDGQDKNGMSQLTQVMLALPSPDMQSFLYVSTISKFLDLYDHPDNIAQTDNAKPKLKEQPKKQTGNDQRNQ